MRLELEADELLGLHLVGHDEIGLAAQAEPQRLSLGVEHGVDALPARLAQGGRVPVLGHVAGQAAGQHDRLAAAQQVAVGGAERLQLVRAHDGPVLDDLGRHLRAGRVEHDRARARLVGDAHELVDDATGGEILHDHVACPTAREPGGDDGLTERPQRTCDVDSLAAGLQISRRATVTAADLQIRDAQGLVDRGVERDRQEHGASAAGPQPAL